MMPEPLPVVEQRACTYSILREVSVNRLYRLLSVLELADEGVTPDAARLLASDIRGTLRSINELESQGVGACRR